MRVLNNERAELAHRGAMPPSQISRSIEELTDAVLDVLQRCQGLTQVALLRYVAQEGMTNLRYEVFRGHARTRTIKLRSLTTAQIQQSASYLEKDQMLAWLSDECIISLRPMLMFRETPDGHETELCFFQKWEGGSLRYEVVGKSEKVPFPTKRFKVDLDEIGKLFIAPPPASTPEVGEVQ
jgi:hypothetical protein